MTDECMKHLYDYLTHELAKRRISMRVFAELCGVHPNEMGRILSGRKKDIYLSTLVRIADALDVPVHVLITPIKQKDYNVEFLEQMYSSMQRHMRKINAA